jgi:hypothetical protein
VGGQNADPSLTAASPGTPSWSSEPECSPTGSGQAAAEGVALFWGAGNAIAALGELLTSRRCQAAGCTVQRVDRAGVQDAADVLEGDADGEVGEGVVV